MTMVLILRDDEYETLINSIEVVDEEDAKFRQLIMDRSLILGSRLIADVAEELENDPR